jgi:tRNA nucleotidyltransferase (CCA-adding enzyme)
VNEHYKQKLIEMRKQAAELIGSLEEKLVRQGKLENSEVYFYLRGLPVEVLLYHMAKSHNSEVKRYISLYFTRLHGVRTQIGGEDLKQLGVERGPRFRELLDAVLSAKLNGRVTSREDELNMVQELISAV